MIKVRCGGRVKSFEASYPGIKKLGHDYPMAIEILMCSGSIDE